MKETWRWFGPGDPVPLDHIKQAGATGIVSALHHLYRGEAWPLDEVFKRRDEILAAGFVWSVVEPLGQDAILGHAVEHAVGADDGGVDGAGEDQSADQDDESVEQQTERDEAD